MRSTYEARHGHSRKPGAGSYRRAMRDRRRKEGEARNRSWQSLSPETKVGQLSRRPGKSAKQIARILKAQNG